MAIDVYNNKNKNRNREGFTHPMQANRSVIQAVIMRVNQQKNMEKEEENKRTRNLG